MLKYVKICFLETFLAHFNICFIICFVLQKVKSAELFVECKYASGIVNVQDGTCPHGGRCLGWKLSGMVDVRDSIELLIVGRVQLETPA